MLKLNLCEFVDSKKCGFQYPVHAVWTHIPGGYLKARQLVGVKRPFSVTACTVVQAVAKATSQSNGKGHILTPRGSETPERISMKLGIYNRVAGMTCKSMWRCDNVGGLGEHVKKHMLWFLRYTFFLLYSSARAERAHVVRFWRSIRHTTCFRPRMCLLGVSLILLPILGAKSPKNPNFGGVNRHFQA